MRKQRRKTDSFLHASRPLGTIQVKEPPSDDFSKPRHVHFHSEWKSTQDDSGRQVWCRNCIQFCASRLHLKGDFSKRRNELYSRDSRRNDPHRRLYSKVLGKRSSSKTLLKVHLLAPGNWCAKGKESRKRIKATRQKTQRYPAPGNWKREKPVQFWSIQGDFIYRHHNEPRGQLYVPKETFTIPLKYSDVTRATCTTLDVLQENRKDEYWNVVANRSLSDSLTGFTKVTLLKGKPPKGYMWSGERLTKIPSMLYIFKDNEAVIKMIIKGRSPTMRHVSRTHRVALDGLFDRINLDP